MKKITLSLFALSTVIFANALTLQCSFPTYKDGKIVIGSDYNDKLYFTYRGPGYCEYGDGVILFGDEDIFLNGKYCGIIIKRSTGDVEVDIFSYDGKKETFKGSCAKKSNVI